MLSYHYFNNKKLLSVFLISLALCVFFVHGFPIYILDEAKNAEAAREMFGNGNRIIPFFNGELRTDKPPLHYFFMMLGYKLFGINPFGARFFSAVMGALTLTCTFYFVRKLRDEMHAVVTWVVLASALFFIQLFHQAVPDPYLVACVSIALFMFFDFYKTRNKATLFGFYILMGLGTLAKGPVAVALPGLVAFIFLWSKRILFTKKLFEFRPFLGMAIVLLIAMPWYLAVHKATDGAWTQGFFLEHNLNRFGGEMEGHGGIFLITWAFVILGLLPFSVFIIQGFANGWKERKNDFVFFSLIMSVVFILFFSISSTKLPNYTMPCYPFVAVLIASYLIKVFKGELSHKSTQWSLIALLIISVALPFAVYFVFSVEKQLMHLRWIGLWFSVVVIGAILALYFIKQKNPKSSFYALGLSWMLMGTILFSVIYPKLLTQNPVTKSSEFMKSQDAILVYKRMDAAYPFNYNRTFEITSSMAVVKDFLEKNPNGYVISNHKEALKEFQGLENIDVLLDYKALFENHKTVIIKRKTN